MEEIFTSGRYGKGAGRALKSEKMFKNSGAEHRWMKLWAIESLGLLQKVGNALLTEKKVACQFVIGTVAKTGQALRVKRPRQIRPHRAK
jgi:hypothetical protein